MCIVCADLSGQFRPSDFTPSNPFFDSRPVVANEPQFWLDLDERGGFGSNGKPSLLPGDAGSQITRSGLRWSGNLGDPATVTYAFRSTAPVPMPSNTQDFSRFSGLQITATELMLQAWADVARITFVRDGSGTSGEGAYSNNATMLFGNYASGAEGAAAFAYLPGPGSNPGDVWINSSLAYNSAPTYLAYGYQVLLHEIGHAIGLSHPAAYNAGGGVSITYSQHAQYYEDSRQYTVMSYFSESNTGGAFGGRYSAAPLLDDIAAAQRLYGANTTTRTGDTVYGFNSTADRLWFSAGTAASPQAVIFAVWDADGIDTLDFSGYTQGGTIDLRQGHFSSVGGQIGNVAVAMGVVIERAVGGLGDDVIFGNSADNRLTGGQGSNIINGGAGTDTAVYSGLAQSYTITADSLPLDGVSYQILYVTGPQGTDVLRNIEVLSFADGTVNVPLAAGVGVFVEGDATVDTLTGTAYADRLFGAGGNDTLNGGDGDDRVDGGQGHDTLNGGLGVDVVDYSSAVGGVSVNLALGQSTGSAGTDTLSNFENIIGGTYSDTLTGDDSANVINGRGGIDTLRGGGGGDTLIAGAGSLVAASDVLKASTTANTSIGSSVNIDGNFDMMNDAGVYNATTIPHAVIRGVGNGSGQEYYAFTVTAGAQSRFEITNAGFDTTLRIFDGSGNQLAVNDDVAVGNQNSLITYTFATAGTYYVAVGSYGSGQGNSVVSGPAPAGSSYVLNVSVPDHAFIPSTDQGSTLEGQGGDDVLHGGTARDILDGGTGTDTAVFSGNRSAWVITDLGNGVYSVSNGTQTDTLIGVEFAQFADQTVTLVTQAAPIDGTSGNDVLTGTENSDIINGLDGDDLLRGQGGADALDGGNGVDTADYSFSDGAVTVRLWNGTGTGAHAQGDTLTSIENVVGSAYADTLVGSAGANRLEGRVGDDNLTGANGDDLLAGGSGTDALFGDDGADILVGGEGADALNGGADIDTADYSGSGGAVTVHLGNGTGAGADAQGDTLTSVENIVGSIYNDDLSGSAVSNRLEGGLGNDILSGLDGDDVLLGEYAADTLAGGAGNDTLIGGDGADSLDGGLGIDTADYSGSAFAVTVRLWNGTGSGGQAQDDTLTSIERVVGSTYSDALIGADSQADTLEGGDGDDYLAGLDGDDFLVGGAGVDSLVGSGGSDALVGGVGADSLDGGAGIDTANYFDSNAGVTVRLWNGTGSGGHAQGDTLTSIERVNGSNFNDALIGADNQDDALTGWGGNDFLAGLAGHDTLSGGDGTDTLEGGDGSDVLNGGAGADTLQGGLGTDTADYTGSNAGVTVRLWNGTGSGGHAQGDTLTSIERVVGSGFNDALIGADSQGDVLWGAAGNDYLAGLNGDDLLYGDDGTDTLVGGGGSDVLVGGAGADALDGGLGTDTADYSGSNAGVTVRLWNGTGSGGHAQGDTLTSIERVVGSNYNDGLIGSDSQADTLEGGVGDDYLAGLNGDDLLSGGDGADTLEGGAGADTLQGGLGTDTADYSASNAGVTVRLWNGTGTGGHAQGDTLTSIERVVGSNFNDGLIGSDSQADTLEGGAGNDYLAGLNGDDLLNGGNGTDTLAGGGGSDVLVGGVGADALDGGLGTDTADYSASNAGVTVRLWNGTGSGGHAQGDTLTSIERVIGSAYNDGLIGADGQADTLEGGAGNDFLAGRTGADRFVFAGASGTDTIGDFGISSGDVIDLQGSVFADFADVLANANDTAGGVQLSKGGVVITLTGVTKAQLTASHFEFAPAPAPALAALEAKDDGAMILPDLIDDEPLVLPGLTADKGEIVQVMPGLGFEIDDPLVLPQMDGKDVGIIDPVVCLSSEFEIGTVLGGVLQGVEHHRDQIQMGIDAKPSEWAF